MILCDTLLIPSVVRHWGSCPVLFSPAAKPCCVGVRFSVCMNALLHLFPLFLCCATDGAVLPSLPSPEIADNSDTSLAQHQLSQPAQQELLVMQGAGQSAADPVNASALGHSLMFCLCVPWALCFLFYFGLYFTYPADRARRKEALELEKSFLNTAECS
jgi:hypothetical protein